jgi:hypothetical protein
MKSLINIFHERSLKTFSFTGTLLIFNAINPEYSSDLIKFVGTAMILNAFGNYPSPLIYAQLIANTQDNKFDNKDLISISFYSSRLMIGLLLAIYGVFMFQDIVLGLFVLSLILNQTAHSLHSSKDPSALLKNINRLYLSTIILKISLIVFVDISFKDLILLTTIENLLIVLLVIGVRWISYLKIKLIKNYFNKDQFLLYGTGMVYAYFFNFDSQHINFDVFGQKYFFTKKILDISILFSGWISFAAPRYFSANNTLKIIEILPILFLLSFIMMGILYPYLGWLVVLLVSIPILIIDAYTLRYSIKFNKVKYEIIKNTFRVISCFLCLKLLGNSVYTFCIYFNLILFVSMSFNYWIFKR